MKKRELGNTGVMVSELGLGAMSLPMDTREANKIVDVALDAGINFVDTADLYNYGENEKIIASLLKGRRNELILATKVGNDFDPNQTGWTWNPSKKHIMEAVKRSLLRLDTDYIDLYQLHGGTMEDNVEETIEAFDSLKKEGLILQYGISSIRPNVIERFLQSSHAVSVMMQYSLLDRQPEEWFDMIGGYDASVITRGTLAKGLLTNTSPSVDKIEKGFGQYEPQTLSETIHSIKSLTEDVHAASIHYVLNNKSVATALVGASSAEQLTDSIGAYRKDVSNTTIAELQTHIPVHQYKKHRP